MNTPEELRNAIAIGISRAVSAARNEPWYQHLPDAFIAIARRQKSFDAVDLWNWLRSAGYISADPDVIPPHASAMGGFLRRLKGLGYAKSTEIIMPRHTWGHTTHCRWEVIVSIKEADAVPVSSPDRREVGRQGSLFLE